jgi:peptidoglycan biosynthesis/recognition FemAB-like protein
VDVQVKANEFHTPPEWDRYLHRARTEAGLCQSAYWGRVISRVDEAKPIFLEATHDDDLAGQLLLFHKRPFNREIRKPLSKAAALRRGAAATLEWMDGPVVHRREHARSVLDALLTWVDEYAKTHSIATIRAAGCAPLSQTGGTREMKAAFIDHGYRSSTWATLLVDLNLDEESLWRALNDSARKGVRRCRREGVVVRRITDVTDLCENFVGPYVAFEAAHGRPANPVHVARIMWEEDAEKYYAYFVAEDRDRQILATLGMYLFNGMATEIASALSPAAYQTKVPAQDILHWEMIRYAKAHGCHTFNLAGVAPQPADAKEAGIRRFKEKWGGRYVEYNRHEKSLGIWKTLRSARDLAKRARRVLSSARKRVEA